MRKPIKGEIIFNPRNDLNVPYDWPYFKVEDVDWGRIVYSGIKNDGEKMSGCIYLDQFQQYQKLQMEYEE